MGISYVQLYMLETGRSFPSAETFKRICKVYDWNQDDARVLLPPSWGKRGRRGPTSKRKDYALSKRYGELIRLWRQRKGLTMIQLSTKAGIALAYLSFIERGAVNPPPYKTGERLAQALGKKPLRLVVLRAAFQVGKKKIGRAIIKQFLPDELPRLKVWEKGNE